MFGKVERLNQVGGGWVKWIIQKAAAWFWTKTPFVVLLDHWCKLGAGNILLVINRARAVMTYYRYNGSDPVYREAVQLHQNKETPKYFNATVLTKIKAKITGINVLREISTYLLSNESA